MKKIRTIIKIILFLIVLIFIFVFSFQKLVISDKFRNILEDFLKKELAVKTLRIGKIDLDYDNLSIEKINFENEQLAFKLANLSLDYSLNNIFRKGLAPYKWTDKLILDKIDLSIKKSDRKEDFSYDLEMELLKKNINKLHNYSFLDTVEIKDVNIGFESSFGLEIFRNFGGIIDYKDKNKIKLEFLGKLGNNGKKNLVTQGVINVKDLSAEFNFQILKSYFEKFNTIFLNDYYDFSDGFFKGDLKLSINSNANDSLKLLGGLFIDSTSVNILKQYKLTNFSSDITFFNDACSINKFNLLLDGVDFNLNGKINNIITPMLDLNLEISNLSKEVLVKYAKINNLFFNNLSYSSSKFKLHLQDYIYSPKIDFKCYLKEPCYDQFRFDSFKLLGFYQEGQLNFKNTSLKKDSTSFVINGKYHLKKKKMEGLFKAHNLYLYDALTYANYSDLKENFKNLRLDFKSNFSLNKNFHVITKSEPSSELEFNSSYKNGTGNFIFYQDSLKTLAFDFLNKEQVYTLFSKDLFKFINQISNKEFSLDKDFVSLAATYRAGKDLNLKLSSNNKAIYGGELKANVELKDTLITVNYQPYKGSFLASPIVCNLQKINNKIFLDSLAIGSSIFNSSIFYNLSNSLFNGNLNAKSFDLASINSSFFTTKTDLDINIGGSFKNPYFDLFIEENGLTKNNSREFLTGSIRLNYANEKLSLNRFSFFKDQEMIFDLNAFYTDSAFRIKTEGNLSYRQLAFLFKPKYFKGATLEYNLELEKKPNKALAFKPSYLNFRDIKISDYKLDKIDFLFSSEDLRRINLLNFNLDYKDYLNIRGEGSFPLNFDDSLNFNLVYNGDFLKFLKDNYEIIPKGTSINEGILKFGGSFSEPKLEDFELSFLDGEISIEGIFKKINKIKGKISLDNKFVSIDSLTMETNKDGLLVFTNSKSDDFLEKIKLPFGYNCGIINILTPKKPIQLGLPGLIKSGEYGSFKFDGYKSNFLKVGRSKNILLGRGKAYLYNTNFTYYPSDDEEEEEAEDYSYFEKYLNLDIEIIPKTNNTYFYSLYEDQSIWEKFKSSMSLKASTNITKVNLPIKSSDQGVKILGNPFTGENIKVLGEVKGNHGTFSFSDFEFEVLEAKFLFDNYHNFKGKLDPYLSALGKTTIRTGMDSTGFVSYEDIYFRIVTKDEEGEIVDYEGGRLSDYEVLLTNENNENFLRDKHVEEIDTKQAVLGFVNKAVDKKVFGLFLDPMQSLIGRVLGANIYINPKVVSNLQDERIYNLENRSYFGNYFVGSEVFFSKPITEFLSFTMKTKYIGSDHFNKDIVRKFGYQWEIGTAYRIGDHLLSTIGYEYDSITEDEGYNISLHYRYQFNNLSNQRTGLIKFFRFVKEYFK